MKYINISIFSIILFTTNINPVFSNSLEISNNTRGILKSFFLNTEAHHDNDIKIKLNGFKVKSNNKYMVEGDVVTIKLFYWRKIQNIESIAVFIDGNKNPLVAFIKPGKSSLISSNVSKRSSITYSVTGVADNYCLGSYKALVVIKLKNKLIANNLPFSTIVADCGGHG